MGKKNAIDPAVLVAAKLDLPKLPYPDMYFDFEPSYVHLYQRVGDKRRKRQLSVVHVDTVMRALAGEKNCKPHEISMKESYEQAAKNCLSESVLILLAKEKFWGER